MKAKTKILLTGASGFLGQRYLKYNKSRYDISPVSLQRTPVKDVNYEGVDVIIHAAGIAHQMKEIDSKIYFDVNYRLTRSFADKAKAEGVKHFIFLSTIKVFGGHDSGVLTEKTKCEPINDPYGQSKLEAEIYLKQIENESFVVSIIRPPLIYGPGVKGNLIRFLKLADTSFLLPFKDINNRRTMVFIDNLIELLNEIVGQKKSGLFLAGDSHPISTSYLIGTLRKKMGKSPNLFSPPGVVRWVLAKFKPELKTRLYDSLELDTENTNKTLNFSPPYTVEGGLETMVEWYNQQKLKG